MRHASIACDMLQPGREMLRRSVVPAGNTLSRNAFCLSQQTTRRWLSKLGNSTSTTKKNNSTKQTIRVGIWTLSHQQLSSVGNPGAWQRKRTSNCDLAKVPLLKFFRRKSSLLSPFQETRDKKVLSYWWKRVSMQTSDSSTAFTTKMTQRRI